MKNTHLGFLALAFVPAMAFATWTQILSFQEFPAPYEVVEDFDQLELAGYGITASGYSPASGSLTGNEDAPMSGAGGALSGDQVADFFFFEPIDAVGFSMADIDFSVDELALISLKAYDAEGNEVANVGLGLIPANTLE